MIHSQREENPTNRHLLTQNAEDGQDREAEGDAVVLKVSIVNENEGGCQEGNDDCINNELV